MLQPNDLPLICLPTELSDEAAAQLLEFLHEITAALERHYCGQLMRHRQHQQQRRHQQQRLIPDSDEPF